MSGTYNLRDFSIEQKKLSIIKNLRKYKKRAVAATKGSSFGGKDPVNSDGDSSNESCLESPADKLHIKISAKSKNISRN